MPTKSKSGAGVRLVHSKDTDTSSVGDDSAHHTGMEINPEAAFMKGLDASLLSAYDDDSSESSYWSDSDESSDDDSSDDDDDDDDDDDQQSGYTSGGQGVESDTGGNDTENEKEEKPRPTMKAKRNNSVLSLDALLKVSLQVSDAAQPQPKDRDARRRGRRLGRDHTPTSLGALARKVGSSTNNDLKDVAATIRRCDSALNLKVRKGSGGGLTNRESTTSRTSTTTGTSRTSTTARTTPTRTTPTRKSSKDTMPSLSSAPKTFMHVQQEGYSSSASGTSSKRTAGRRRSGSGATATASVQPKAPTPAFSGGRKTGAVKKYGEHAKKMVNPREHYLAILHQMGVEAPLVPYDALEDFFVPMTMEDRAAFDWELVQSIRDHNMGKLKRLHKAGHHMSARAQFGESIVHICARRGTPEMLRYLLEDATVSARVCCDYGRTPLHDAAWSTDAKSLKMMQILITACPDLLLIQDKRGFMPLDYIPKDRWPHCCAFLDKHKSSLMPTGVLFGESSGDEDSDYEEEESGEELDF
ncbi:ANK [Seminavis robusta]|uniref:ANK n=1 Tax=Seminavis robusta TaxID=568900 RepID=A0A9N8H573_9STRA|nr:ANK [Seminavis robusta]|eukprot:Sro105_g053280.1 ANK (527) ;mRNA; f:82236-83816